MKIRQVPPPDIEPEFVLTLNRSEILALSAVTGFISGEPDGPRGVFDELSRKIQAISLPHYRTALRELGYSVKYIGGIRFERQE